MAKYGQADADIKIDISDGGALTSIKAYVDTINGVKVFKPTEQSDTFGDSWEEALQTGIRRLDPIEIEGFYDDTASTGPDAVLNVAAVTHAATRTLEVTYGSTKKSTVEVWITSYERLFSRGRLTRYKAVLQPTGSVTEA